MQPSWQNLAQVSAIVPARNEGAVIAACVASLDQTEIAEILVIDDQSMDQTATIVRQLMNSMPKLRLLQTKELPAGWVGKNYAVWLGAREAKSAWLLFTDADALHKKDSAAHALAIAANENAAMVSFSPEQVMQTWYEKALIPCVYCRLASKFSFDEINDPKSPAAAANGQFLLIRKDAYETVGGHASVASEVLEDVALAKLVKSAGYRIWFGSGTEVVRVRMYRSFRAMWQGWKKNLYQLMGGNLQTVMKEIARALLPILVNPILAFPFWLLTKSVLTVLVILILGTAAISLAYVKELRRNHFPDGLAIYALPASLLFAAVLGASYLSHKRGKLEWKGREYPAGTPGASK
jgi:cellulose synthase/poly-beta-1,6-N-acetylglucosamine synthase-like glycosyltransferase